jgi:hypothetical protein
MEVFNLPEETRKGENNHPEHRSHSMLNQANVVDIYRIIYD